ncbi:hypothetical protein HR060_10080 [Catenovulum sp. SM1970]|uniref:hypothetical protein n=1 Tax=Marinifaba aquimaris TaxID=2741323 RepID=UPI001572268B|nr:hypothetical protein [Marinifaba aquimaris]NTS77211.1 hypothetical protein [Marinifaba aquimaris]
MNNSTDPNFEKALQTSLNSMPETMVPKRDLWRGIDQAITKKQQDSEVHKPIWNVLGAVGTAVALALFVVSYFSSWSEHQLGVTEPVKLMANNFAKDKKALLASFGSQPIVVSNLEQQLSELAEAELSVTEALEKDPNNPALIRMLANIYKQQLVLIQKAHQNPINQI